MDYLRNLDAFPKYKAKDTRHTTSGMYVHRGALIMFCLFVSEFLLLSHHRGGGPPERQRHAQHLVMRFDIVFPHIPCDLLLSLDTMDSSKRRRRRSIVTSSRSDRPHHATEEGEDEIRNSARCSTSTNSAT